METSPQVHRALLSHERGGHGPFERLYRAFQNRQWNEQRETAARLVSLGRARRRLELHAETGTVGMNFIRVYQTRGTN